MIRTISKGDGMQLDEILRTGALDEAELQAYVQGYLNTVESNAYLSLRRFADMKKDRGLLLLIGDRETILENTTEIRANSLEMPEGFLNYGKRPLLASDNHPPCIYLIFDIASQRDGALCCDRDGYFILPHNRFVENVITNGYHVDGGTRHRAACYASTIGMTSMALSQEHGVISVYKDGSKLEELTYPR